jgi:hypothetical protein
MRALKIALVAAALGAAAACTGSASAMPVGGLAAASNELANGCKTCAGLGGIDAGGTRAITPIDPYYNYSPYYAYYGWPYYRPYWGLGWGWGALWW